MKDLRGLTDCKLVIADEFAFFDPVDQLQILPVLEAFRQKSNAQLVLLSTPSAIGDVFHKLFQEPAQTCRYHRLYLPYTKALGTLFTEEEIAQAKKQPNFQQEFNLKFGSFGQNSLFSLDDIDYCVNQSKENYGNYYDFNNNAAEVFAIGCDPGWGSSKTGISMICLYDKKIIVLASEEHEKANEDFVISRLIQLRQRYSLTVLLLVLFVG